MRNRKHLKIVASIEARMTSSRLPGKVLMPAAGKPLLQWMIERIRASTLVDDIVVATTINKADDPIVELCERLGVRAYRGSEFDVLERVLNAHQAAGSDVIVELTGDCPLVDPRVIDRIIREYMAGEEDYVSNSHVRSYPDGFDVQVFARSLLEEVARKTVDSQDREHVSLYIYRSGEYRLKAVVAEAGIRWPELRLTLDNEGDYRVLREIFESPELKDSNIGVEEVVQFIRHHPELLAWQEGAIYNAAPFQKYYSEV